MTEIKTSSLADILGRLGVVQGNVGALMSRWGHPELKVPKEDQKASLEKAVTDLEEIVDNLDKGTCIWDANTNGPADARIIFRPARPRVGNSVTPMGTAVDAWARKSGGYVIKPEPHVVDLLLSGDTSLEATLVTGKERTKMEGFSIQPIWAGETVTVIIVEEG